MRLIVTLKPENYEQPRSSFGVIAEIDWESKKFIRYLKIPSASFHDSGAFMAPLMGGLCHIGSRLFVAAWNFVIVVDYNNFEILDTFSHPYMADLHGMNTDGSNIWVISTAIESLLCFDPNTYSLNWRWGPDEPILSARAPAGKKTRSLDRLGKVFSRSGQGGRTFAEREFRYVHKGHSAYHQHHLNDVRYHRGELYLTTKGWFEGTSSAVIRLNPRTQESEFFVEPGGFRAMHDGEFLEDRFVVTESAANGVAWRNADGTIETRRLKEEPYFTRGLAYTGHSFLVGFTTFRGTDHPAQIAEYDHSFTNEISSMCIDEFYPPEVGTAIHAMIVMSDRPED